MIAARWPAGGHREAGQAWPVEEGGNEREAERVGPGVGGRRGGRRREGGRGEGSARGQDGSLVAAHRPRRRESEVVLRVVVPGWIGEACPTGAHRKVIVPAIKFECHACLA